MTAGSADLCRNRILKAHLRISLNIGRGNTLSIAKKLKVRVWWRGIGKFGLGIGVFNQRPGSYHGFLNDLPVGGTYTVSKPEQIFKWSLGLNKQDAEFRSKIKEDIHNRP